jgi:AcrR family transcriptional regulator
MSADNATGRPATGSRPAAAGAAEPGPAGPDAPGKPAPPSARRAELLELAYQYAVSRGQAELSLRPLARAIGSSPRVLLYLFGSKDGLIRALLARARADELALLAGARDCCQGGLAGLGERTWSWLADDRHRGLLKRWADG